MIKQDNARINTFLISSVGSKCKHFRLHQITSHDYVIKNNIILITHVNSGTLNVYEIKFEKAIITFFVGHYVVTNFKLGVCFGPY